MFGGYAPSVEGFEPIQDIAQELLSQGKIVPIIMVGPAIPGWVSAAPDGIWGYYFYQEIVPFIKSKYRVARERTHWGSYGISKGGNDGPALVFKRPEMFSLVGIGAGATWFDHAEALANYTVGADPLEFWLWHAEDDNIVSFATSELFEQMLIEQRLDYTFVAIPGGEHDDCIRPPAFRAALEWFSDRFQAAGVAVAPVGKLTTSWAAVKAR